MNCPFCGSEAELIDQSEEGRFYLCENPECDMPDDYEHVFGDADVLEAAADESESVEEE